jgi:ribosomal protein S12
MSMLERMAEERRLRGATAQPPAAAGEQWATCVGVHEVDRHKPAGRRRTIARVLLASGMVITAYLPANSVAPAVDAPVLVQTTAIGDCCGEHTVVLSAVSDQPSHGGIVAS